MNLMVCNWRLSLGRCRVIVFVSNAIGMKHSFSQSFGIYFALRVGMPVCAPVASPTI
jgi:hypothetical protein